MDTGHYTASLTGAAGTVAEGVIQTVEAYNVPRIHGDLIVSKDVLYPDWMTDISALEAQRFTLAVELSGADPETTYETSEDGLAVTTDTAGSAAFTVSLQDAQSMTVYGLPAGAAYTVREENTPAGYQSNGTITGTVPERGAAEAAVVNTYAPAPAETTLTITGTKHFLDSTKQSVAEDRWPQEGFTMELHRVDFSGGTDTLLVDDITATAQDPSWSVELPLTFPKTGVYYYRICEKAGTAQGVIYDTTNGIFRVLVTDNGTGTLIVSAVEPVRDTVTVSGTTITKDFCNYLDTATVQIPVKKIVTGTTVYDHDDFLFGLYDEAGNLVDTVIGNGTFQITGEFADTKTYTIRELIPEMDQRIVGMTYDDMVYTVTVNGDEVTIRDLPEGETGPVFHNTYEKVVSYPAIDLGGTKTITGDRTAFLAGESYTFELYETDASFRADHGKLVATETVDGADPAYGFAGLTFTEEGTYYFVLKEQDGTQGGITYDHTRYHVTIRVTKAEDGTGKTVLQAAADITRYGSNEKIPVNLLDFANTYRVSGTGQLAIDGTKTLVGRDLTAGLFSFTLSQGDQVLQTVQNSLSGKFRFDPITYTAADLGDHTYTVREVPGDLPGMTYDDRVYTVTVRVSDDGQGGLRVERTGEAILFENTYTPKPISTTIRGTKTLYDVDKQTYIELGDHEFAFELYRSERDFGEQKELLQTATVDDTGNFSFKLHYDTTYDNYYIIREVIGDDPEIAYDAGRYLVRILVSDNGAGELVTTMTLVHEGVGAADLMIFENRFDAQEKPEPKPEPETPNTGDDFRLLPVIGCMVASLMGLAVVTVLKKRSAK